MKISHALLLICFASPAAPAAAGDWTGWYAGAHLGHGSGDADSVVGLGGAWSTETQALQDEVAADWSTRLDPGGGAYGLQLGYNHQFAGGFVLGAELDWSTLGIDDSRRTGLQPTATVPSLSYDFSNAVELDDRLALKARLGFASGRHLWFASVGWVQVDARASAAVASNGNYLKAGGRSGTIDGTEWGLGYEFDLGNRWTLRGEYLMTDLDPIRFDTDYLPGSSFTSPAYLESVRQDVDFDTFRLALNFRF